MLEYINLDLLHQHLESRPSLFDKLMNSMMIENNIIKWTNIGWVRIWGGIFKELK